MVPGVVLIPVTYKRHSELWPHGCTRYGGATTGDGGLQLIALALPAFAILLELVVESEMSYTKYAILVTTAGFLLFLVGGIIVLGQLVVMTTSTTFAVALGLLGFGMGCMLIGATTIGLQTRKKQFRTLETGDDD